MREFVYTYKSTQTMTYRKRSIEGGLSSTKLAELNQLCHLRGYVGTITLGSPWHEGQEDKGSGMMGNQLDQDNSIRTWVKTMTDSNDFISVYLQLFCFTDKHQSFIIDYTMCISLYRQVDIFIADKIKK